MRRWITALTMLGMAGAGVVAAVPAAMAATPGCLVVDTNSNQSYPSLQDAVNAASAGDTLFVKGTCTSVFTEIGKSLTITGQSNGGTTTATLGGFVDISGGATVTLNTLVITGPELRNILATVTLNHSTVTSPPGTFGGGIENSSGTMTLNDSTVTGNTANQPDFAGGINNIDGTLILNGSSRVAGNKGTFGGIQNSGTGRATLIMNGSSTVTGNTAAVDGGGIFNNGGTVTMNGSSSITGNTAIGAFGGGIDNAGGTVTMNDSSTVTGNSVGGNGVTGFGGGIDNFCGTLNGAVAPPAANPNVFNNTPDDIATQTC